ncbi:hypothetical protein [Agrobacterium sp. CG674]
MTPAEHARQIDREEFAAECAAVRERAVAYSRRCQTARADRITAWLNENKNNQTPRPRRVIARPNRNAVEAASRANAAKAKQYVAFGQSRSLREWAEETGIVEGTIRSRLNYGWTLEDALRRKVQEHRERAPGGVFRLQPSKGTGAGSTLQETPNITFSQEAAE